MTLKSKDNEKLPKKITMRGVFKIKKELDSKRDQLRPRPILMNRDWMAKGKRGILSLKKSKSLS
jgi:hypothetical protein